MALAFSTEPARAEGTRATEPLLQIQPHPDAHHVTVAARIPKEEQAKIPVGKLSQEQGESWLRLMLVGAELDDALSAMLGHYERRDETLSFTPRYALVPGKRYLARVAWGTTGAAGTVVEYRAPALPAAPAAQVVAIYPTAAELPANQLKFYLHFSQPMRQTREIFEHIDLLGPQGRPVEDPWRRTELWSEDGKRLTLLIHPGRIKQGIQLGTLLGPVLDPDQSYTLIVHATMLDANGRPLGQASTKKFRTKQAERTLPSVKDWRVAAPRRATQEPVRITFPRPMDRALLDRMLTVKTELGEAVGGRIEIRSEETVWDFHPHHPWRDSPYIVVVDPRLEDLAGNNPGRLFDAAFTETEPVATTLEIPFQPAPQ
ncbi:hypothetical protein LBMAG56_40780 [Verrucomicrobiota bacterium]|nr:hypothetical protein LBMAG56_40780 [Verrucomicrobiota bacterium]